MFLESVTIAPACNKVMRKRFLKPNTIGLIPSDGNTGNVNDCNNANVACGVRMHFYSHLDKLGELALYCDTGSVILYRRPTNHL